MHYTSRSAVPPKESTGLLDRLLNALPEAPLRFEQTCLEVRDWESLLHLAQHHGVHGVIHCQLEACRWPLPKRTLLRSAAALMREQHLAERLDEWLHELLADFAAANVPVIPLKGPVLGERLYPRSVPRPATDLDLLVTPQDLDRAAVVLQKRRYRPLTGPREEHYRARHHHLHFASEGQVPIELHFRAHSGFHTEIRADDLFARAGAYRTRRGRTVPVLAAEDELIYLATHVASHLFQRTAWLYDIKLLLLRDGIDSLTLATRARELRLERVTAYTLSEVKRRLGGAVPLLRNRPEPTRQALTDFVLRTATAQGPGSLAAQVGRVAFTSLLCDHASGSARYLYENTARAGRRGLHRLLPGRLPIDWSI
jgi:Uncharacterised nucleotidyltransferase